MKSRLQVVSGGDWMPDCGSRSADAEATQTVEGVMRYLRDAAGFEIKIRSNVPICQSWHRTVSRVGSEAEALSVLKDAVAELDCTVLRKGRLLTLLTWHDAKKECVPLPTWR